MLDSYSSLLTSIYLFVFGAAIGSFLNVLIDRLPQEKSIGGRSHCDSCKKTLRWIDLFPLFSYSFLKGRCRYCNSKIPAVSFFIELLTGVLFIFTYFNLGQSLPEKIIYLGIVSSLIVVFFADAKYQIIPESIQFVLFILAIALLFTHPQSISLLRSHLISAAIIMAPILLLYIFTKGRGMGFGDVKFAFNMGLIVGTIGGFAALYFAFITGAMVAIALLVVRKSKLKSKIAFGPFLVLGLLVALFYNSDITGLIKKIYGF